MRYVLATDGSKSSLKAGRFLVEHFCPGAEDEVLLVFVFPIASDLASYTDVVSLPTRPDDERVKAVARPVIEATREAIAEFDSRIEEVVLVGNPAKEIVELATSLKADLVIAGNRGRSTTSELYLGSVSSALVHRAPCSVLIAR